VPRAKRKEGWVSRPWTTLRKVVQYLTLCLFLVLYIVAPRTDWSPTFTSFFIRIDPLAALTNLLANRTIVAGMSLALVLILLTLGLGRVWCGWACPLGTILDLFSLRRWRRNRAPSETWRQVKHWLLLITLFAALFGNLTLLILDPLTIMVRTFSVSLWPALDRVVTLAEERLYQFPVLQESVSTFDRVVRPMLLPPTPRDLRGAALFGTIFIIIVLLNLAAERFWCRYLCPLGSILGLLSKVAIVRRQVNSACKDCGICARVCPTGTIRSNASFASDPGECTMCLDCVDDCPFDAHTFAPQIELEKWNHYDPGRREALLTFGIALGGVAALRGDLATGGDNPYLIRPPGAGEDHLNTACVRCGQCVRVCPTGGLYPSLTEAGVKGLWTPVLIPRLGYCNYSCNACGLSCPVEAIPPLSLEQKQHRVIGYACIDKDHCIPWVEEGDCIVCEEMCPLPEKAIELESLEVLDESGDLRIVQRPEVVIERCIGCGICEYKCPVEGEAAIRVRVTGGRRSRQRRGWY
jgi:polyferredoxin